MNSYELSRIWFDWCFENPDKINTNHHAVYFFAIEHCNRLGWKQKFGFPSQMAMEALGIKSWKTYSNTFNDLVEWGFFKLLEKSKNQYSANVIAIVKNTKAHTKALDKALSKHSQKHAQSTHQSNASINKQETKNKEQVTTPNPLKGDLTEKEKKFLEWFNSMLEKYKGSKGRFRTMSQTDRNNLKKLRASYADLAEWEIAFKQMTLNPWVIENNKNTVDHLLRPDNFMKYLNEGVLNQQPAKHKAPWQ